MAIQPSEIGIIPAVEAKTFDKYWMQNLIISAPSLTDKAEVVAKLVPYNSTTGEMFTNNTVTLVIDDILTKAMADAPLAFTINNIFTEIDRQAKLQDLI
jgi:hypothetical protein